MLLAISVRVRPCSPFGPFTVTAEPSTFTSTPAGMSMGSRPIRDMELPHVGEDFPTHALLLGLAVGQKTAGGGQDRDAEAAEHLGDLGRLRVDAEAGLRDALDAHDGALAVRAELEGQRERRAHASVGDLEAGDVALVLE